MQLGIASRPSFAQFDCYQKSPVSFGHPEPCSRYLRSTVGCSPHALPLHYQVSVVSLECSGMMDIFSCLKPGELESSLPVSPKDGPRWS